MEKPWSIDNVSPGSTSTNSDSLRKLEAAILEQKKQTLHQVPKSGSKLEIYGENPRILINTLRSSSAAIWSALYDGSLLELLTEESQKTAIKQLLQTHFSSDSLPVIPILRPTEEAPPKIKYQGERTRVYSMHGGANLRTMLELGTADPFGESHFPREYTQLKLKLAMHGISIAASDQIFDENTEPLSRCKQLLESAAQAKQQCADLHPSDEVKRWTIELELYSKLYVTHELLGLLGVSHGHPHGGNWVVTWSAAHLDQTQLEQQLVQPTVIDIDLQKLISQYPDCELHPLLIDFDLASFEDQAGNKYDQSKLQIMLYEQNPLQQTLALELTPLRQLSDEFFKSLFTVNQHLIPGVLEKIGSIFWSEEINPELLVWLTNRLLQAGVGLESTTMLQFMTPLIPAQAGSDTNRHAWLQWIAFFNQNPAFAKLRPSFFKQSMQLSSYTTDKEVYLIIIERLLDRDASISELLGNRLKSMFLGKKSAVRALFG